MALIVVSCRGSNAAGSIPVIQDWSEDVIKEAEGACSYQIDICLCGKDVTGFLN